MTVDAALFVRDGRIDRAEHLLALDVEQLRHWFWLWRRCDGLERERHLDIRRRRQDLASRAADRGQVEIGTVAVLLVERLDGMGAERSRDRRAFSELRSDDRIVGDKGVYQLERDDLFAALVLLEPVEAEIIEAATNGHGKDGTEAQMQHEAATGTRPHKAPDRGKLTHPPTLVLPADNAVKALKKDDLRHRQVVHGP